MFYLSISVAVISTVLYHISQKSTPTAINPAVALLVTYGAAFGLTLLLLVPFPIKGGLIAELHQLNWASFLLAVAVVGLEVGFLLVYRSGWNVGLAALLVNVAASLILVPVAVLVFRDKLNWVNLVGIATCVAGLIMLNWRR
jgi:multidrug transporter EmrE-like cation transporter